MRGVFDVEANGLLDHTTIDYRAAPFKLKPIFRVWCAVIIDIDTGRVYRFAGEEEMRTGFVPLFKKLKTVIGHNIIDYDLLVLKLYFDIDYEIADQCTIDGQPVEIVDTLVWSKALNPDRYGGHSLDEWGKRLGLEKIDWRQRAVDLGLIPWNAPRGAEFAQYHPEMLDYNERDCHVNVKLYWALLEEVGEWDWSDTFTLEQCVRDIVTRGSHRGFWFDQELAQANVRDLDEKMESIRQTVEPLLPEKPMGVTKLKAFLPPKIQFLKNGNPSSHMQKFAEKHGGTLEQVDGRWVANIFGKAWSLPMAADVPVKTHEPATVKDTTHIKGWLVEMGWRPTQYKERDLTCDSKKKKLSPEKFAETVERYVEQTINSPFCRDRCEELNTVPSRLREKLLKHDLKRPLKVYTNPTITVGMEKEIDPALLELADKFPHAKLVSEYLTYTHRRNSILGGGVDPDELEDDDEFAGKGFLAAERIAEDGRIPTPADSCGAGTSRFKHRLVANIPRVTSLYGKNMRAQFGVDVDDGFVQLGYDFDSLEAKIEAHYVYRYKGGPEYGVSLTAEKPNDCHSVLARMISEILGREFPRSTAKNVKYGCLPVDNTDVLTRDGWKTFNEIGVGDFVLGYHATNKEMYWTEVTGRHFYADADVGLVGNKRWSVEATEDHRWLAKNAYSDEVRLVYTDELNTASSILNSSPMRNGGTVQNDAALIGWLLADGYWKWSESLPCRQNRHGEKLGVIANVGQKKFCDDVEVALRMARVNFTVYSNGGMNEYRIDPEDFRAMAKRHGFYGKGKHEFDWVQYVLGLDGVSRMNFILAFWQADGRQGVINAVVVRQRPGNIADAIAVAMALEGMKTTVRIDGEGMATINGSRSAYTGYQTGDFTPTRKTDVFCLSTACESFFIRQGGVLTLTGNCSYNAQPPRVAKTIGCSLEDAQTIFDTFWTQAAPLKELKEKMQQYWETTGQKKFLKGLDNRKLPIRSKGNVINTAFQSAGVICAKRAMVLHDRKLKAEGMAVDFFRDNWKEKEFCQQLIAYHDEAQLEVKRSLVKFKTFPVSEWQTKNEETGKMEDSKEAKDAKAAAAAFKAAEEEATGKRWSDVMKGPKGYFVGYCRAGELATEAVVEAGRYYKLNVELSAGYMLGRNWAECH